MHSALWVSKTGMAAQDTKMTAISNNLANVNTVGFKRDRVVFEDLFYSIQRQPGAQVDQVNELQPVFSWGAVYAWSAPRKSSLRATRKIPVRTWIWR